MKIRELRLAANLTQVQLAEIVDVGQATIAGWESGSKYPTADKLPMLADALHCSIDALYGRSQASA